MNFTDPLVPQPFDGLPVEAVEQVTNALAAWLTCEEAGPGPAGWGEKEWQAAENLAYWQAAVPWLVKRIRLTGTAVPGSVLARLEAVDELSRQRTLLMLDGTAQLFAELEHEGIQAMPLKGAILASQYYEEAGIRPFGDVDILVRAKDMPRTGAVLERLGYRFFRRSNKDVMYLRGSRKENVWAPDHVHPVEVHHLVLCEFSGFVEDLTGLMWRSSAVQPFWKGTPCLGPSRPALFHHVCAHAAADWVLGEGKLMQVIDICTLAAHMTAGDWRDLLAGIPAGGERFVYPAAALAQRIGGANIPPGILLHLRQLSPPQLKAWVDQAAPADLFQTSRGGVILRTFQSQVAVLFARSSMDRIALAVRLLFPPRWHSRLEAYPRLVASPFWPLAYILLNTKRTREAAEALVRQALPSHRSRA